MVWRLMLPHLGAICSVVSYHVEPQILEMLANSEFLWGMGGRGDWASTIPVS